MPQDNGTSNTKSKDSGAEARLKRSADPGREPRSMADVPRTNEDGTASTVEERRRAIRNEWAQEALPTPPEIPGFHLCWLSTTNSYDPIHKRLRMGYTPVRAEEVLGFDTFRMRGGEWDGFVGCNEMILFKIPAEIYQDIMTVFHHDMPIEEERAIRDRSKAMLGKLRLPVKGEGEEGEPQVDDTLEQLGRPVRAPIFHP